MIGKVKVMNRFLCFVALISSSVFNIDCMDLIGPLSGVAPLKITTLIRSVSKALVPAMERSMIQSVIKCLKGGIAPDDFSAFGEKLSENKEMYRGILNRLQSLKSNSDTPLNVLKFLLRNATRNLNITLTETDIIELAEVLVVKEKWEKEDFIKFGEKQSDFWDTLAEYDDEVSEVAKEKFLKYTDADILKIFFLCKISLFISQFVN